jgi:LytS/YehU family sensor histidine kinase
VAGFAEFFSAVLGVTGAACLGIAHSLQMAMEEVAARPHRPGEAHAVQQALVALPAVAFAAGVVLGGAVLAWLLRWFIGVRPWLSFTAILIFGGLVLFAGRTVVRSARMLFAHASQQAAAAAQARSDATAAQLGALQARMNPHFLFNALNTVASLVRSDPRTAERVVENLADVLRRTLDQSALRSTTVAEEVDYLRAFLALEQQRWGDRLRIAWDVAEDARDVGMPPLMLQPIVENALRHGLGSRMSGGCITIAVRRDAGRLVAAVTDDGEGFVPGWREGTGLGNLRERLETLFGPEARLQIDPLERGSRVTVQIPCAS